MNHNSSYIHRIFAISVANIYNEDIGRCEAFRKFLTWAEPEPKRGGYAVPSAQPAAKRLLQTNCTHRNSMLKRVPFGYSNHQIWTNANGEPPNPKKFSDFGNSFHPSRPTMNLKMTFFQIRAKMAEISPENSVHQWLQDKRNYYRQQITAFAAWSSRTAARRQYSPLCGRLSWLLVSI